MPSMLGMFAALAVTVGLLVLVLHLVRRWSGTGGLRGDALPLEVLQRTSVGPRQGVALLRVGRRVFVVSVAEAGTRVLTELAGDDLQHVLIQQTTKKQPLTIPAKRLLRMAGFAALLAGAMLLSPDGAMAQSGSTVDAIAANAPQFDVRVGSGENGLHLSGTVGIVVFMTVLTVLPALFLLMTSFTRILIVLHFLRSAMGTPTTPPSQLLVIIAVVLTGLVMKPVVDDANSLALQPYLRGEIEQAEAYRLALEPFRGFMLANTHGRELSVFTELTGADAAESLNDIPTVTIISSFVTSELKTAFQMGFVIFLPFIVVDLIVAAVLMSLGMFMLPPVLVSLPFKLMLFVLADGWTLIVYNLVSSFSL